jgi:hypothetical protein
VDGAPSIDGGAGLSAPEDRQMAAQAVQLTSKAMKRSSEDASKTAAITSSENLGPVALTNQSCSGHP